MKGVPAPLLSAVGLALAGTLLGLAGAASACPPGGCGGPPSIGGPPVVHTPPPVLHGAPPHTPPIRPNIPDFGKMSRGPAAAPNPLGFDPNTGEISSPAGDPILPGHAATPLPGGGYAVYPIDSQYAPSAGPGLGGSSAGGSPGATAGFGLDDPPPPRPGSPGDEPYGPPEPPLYPPDFDPTLGMDPESIYGPGPGAGGPGGWGGFGGGRKPTAGIGPDEPYGTPLPPDFDPSAPEKGSSRLWYDFPDPDDDFAHYDPFGPPAPGGSSAGGSPGATAGTDPGGPSGPPEEDPYEDVFPESR